MSFAAFISSLNGTGSGETGGSGSGQLFQDDFNGTSLSGWTSTGFAFQTITVSGGLCRIQGTGSDWANGLAIQNSSYGKSTLRNFTIKGKVKANAFPTNALGCYVGANTQRPTSQKENVYAVLDFVSSKLKIAFANDNATFMVGDEVAIATINTTDFYELSLNLTEDVVTATCRNLTTSVENSIDYTYNMGAIVDPMLINIRRYSFGALGSADVSFDYMELTTTEVQNVDILFLGESTTAGLYAGNAANGHVPKLAAHTAMSVQILAGGGDRISDITDDLPEIIWMNPAHIFLMEGTNDNDAGTPSAVFTAFQTLVNTIRTALPTVTMHICATVSGGNPATVGTFNYKLSQEYGSDFIDTWTTGWSVIGSTSGESLDGIHYTATGATRLSNVIKAARPTIFNI